MKVKGGSREIVLKVLKVLLAGLTALAFIKAIWVSLDIDESYAVALGYRLVRGDRLMRDMWEPHQFSALIAAFLAAPYIWIRGNTEYLVIWLRIAGALVHLGLGLLLYRRLRSSVSSFSAYVIVLLHLNYLPKWIQMPEFELIHYWCLLGIFLALHAYYTGGGKSRVLPAAAGCFYVCSILCYPTMFILYPFYILIMCLLERQYCRASGRKVFKSCCLFTGGALLTGTALLAYLFSYMSFGDFRRYLSYIFLDTSHGVYTMSEKWAMYLAQIQEQWKDYVGSLLAAAVILLVLWGLYRMILKVGRRQKEDKSSLLERKGVLKLFLAVLLLAGLLMQLEAVFGCLLHNGNQFYLQARYIAVLLPAMVIGIRYRRRMGLWLYLCVIPGFLSVAAVLFLTNMDTNTTYAKGFLGVLGSLLIFRQYACENLQSTRWEKLFSLLQGGLEFGMLAALLVCRLVLIRVSGCLPVTVLAPLEKMEAGPEKGIYVLADTAEVWNDNYRELDKYIDREDQVLYIGAESLAYVGMEAVLSTPSTLGTVVYNEMFLYYYEEHPDRIPDVVVFDKTFGENPAYSLTYALSVQSGELFRWVEENYGDEQVIETEHLMILKKRQEQ